MKTRKLFIAIFIALMGMIVCNIPAFAADGPPLPPDQVKARFEQIHNKYSVGDVLDEADAAFVRQYAQTAQPKTMDRSEDSFNRSNTSYGITTQLRGRVWHNGAFSYNFGGNVTATVTSGPTPKSMQIRVTLDAFGADATNPLHLVRQETLSASTVNSRSLTLNKSMNYNGVTALHSINTYLDVVTPNNVHYNWSI